MNDEIDADIEAEWTYAIETYLDARAADAEEATIRFYGCQLRQVARYATERGIALGAFRAIQMRKYMATRRETGLSDSTLRHDVVAVKVFCKFCATNDLITSNPLAAYRVPKMVRPFVKCPSGDELQTLLTALKSRWNPLTNPDVQHVPQRARTFHSRRNYAIVTGLLDTGCRIGEMLNATWADVDTATLQIVFRQTKTDTPRIVPISAEWADALSAWKRVRPHSANELIFVNENGGRIDVSTFSRIFRGYVAYAGLEGFSLHGLRHYAVSQMAIRAGVAAARDMAGHTSLATTSRYVHVSAEVLRSAHSEAAPLRNLLQPKRGGAKSPRRNLVREARLLQMKRASQG